MPTTTTEEQLERKVKEALLAWAGLAAFVGAYDAWAKVSGKETMSHGFRRALRHQKKVVKWGVPTIWGLITWHLFLTEKRLLPERAHEHYVRFHPIWRAGSALELRQGSPRRAAETFQP